MLDENRIVLGGGAEASGGETEPDELLDGGNHEDIEGNTAPNEEFVESQEKSGDPKKEKRVSPARRIVEFFGGKKAKAFFEGRDVESQLREDVQVKAFNKSKESIFSKKEEVRLLEVDRAKKTVEVAELQNELNIMRRRLEILENDIQNPNNVDVVSLLEAQYGSDAEIYNQKIDQLEKAQGELSQLQRNIEIEKQILEEMQNGGENVRGVILERIGVEFMEKIANEANLEENEAKLKGLEGELERLRAEYVGISNKINSIQSLIERTKSERKDGTANALILRLEEKSRELREGLVAIEKDIKANQKNLDTARDYSHKIAERMRVIESVTEKMGLGETLITQVEEVTEGSSQSTSSTVAQAEGKYQGGGVTRQVHKYGGGGYGGGNGAVKEALKRKKKKGFFSSLFGNWFN